MFNMNGNKNKKTLRTVMIVILILAMVLPGIAAYLSF